MATLPMDRIGAGSAVSNALRKVGSVLGVAVLGTIVSSTYQHRIAPSLAGLPVNIRDAAGTSARQPARRRRHRTAGPGARREQHVRPRHATPRQQLPRASSSSARLVLTLAFRVSRRTHQVPAEPEPTTVEV
jgi:hypothetical protein